jgi:hypothetical protein
MEEHILDPQAASQLEDAGFIVQREVRIDTVGRRTVQVDVIGWAASVDGELFPDVIVETKMPMHDGHLRDAARQLGYYLPLVGAARAYVFDGSWHAVGDDFETTVTAECPRPSHDSTAGRAPKQLMRTLVWKSMVAMGQSMSMLEAWERVLEMLASGAPGPAGVASQLVQLARSEANAITVAEVMLESVVRAADRSGEVGCYYTPANLDAALVRLLSPDSGWAVLDPFCGMGGTLLAVHRHAMRSGQEYRLVGADIIRRVASRARQLLQLAGAQADIRDGDSLQAMPIDGVDGIVTSPPIGLKLERARQLSLGGTTRDGEVLAVDKILGSLRDGGRAVVLLAPHLLFAGGSTELFRKNLAGKARVVSIIELPPQLLFGTAIRCAVLVLERGPATDTLVARLEDDWENQLSDDGEFMRQYRCHLETRA